MIDLKNKNVLITGGSRGIGKACVKMFLTAGANVAFTYFTAEESANEIIKKFLQLKKKIKKFILLV